ncbi:MAG: hypothetical protein KDB35_13430 [Acidimicrobiales bacterium]|nr:hypothetical protein [Acidimicrobiales bacterium]MCB1018163.1 hypothetical protein [Acidimicrobiales bacterium]MCB9371906.1 hypothetical protein [Microthrixaceae bacterium]
MSEAIEQLNEIESKALEAVEKVQEPIVEGVRSAAEWAEARLPEVKVPSLDRIGTADEYVAFAFEVVDAVVKNQKAFVGDLLTATAGVRAKFVDADAKPVRPVKSTTKKAA